MRKAVYLALLFAAIPFSVSAQSLEWLKEHPGSSTPELAQVAIAAASAIGSNEGLEHKVRTYFSENPIMSEIARCESRFRQFDANGRPLDGGSGSMIGIFQVHARVHSEFAKSLGMDIYTVEGNLAYARYLYQKEGTAPWISSFDCWHNASQTNSVPVTTLSRNLFLGVISLEVKALQILLNSRGYVLAPDGPGSPGEETEKFGMLTRAAVRKFQCEKMSLCSGDEHSNGYGMVGVSTREALLGSVAVALPPVPEKDNAAEIERLTKLIAELTAKIFTLKNR